MLYYLLQLLYQALHKAGQAIDHLNANQVALQHRNAQLEAQLDDQLSRSVGRFLSIPILNLLP